MFLNTEIPCFRKVSGILPVYAAGVKPIEIGIIGRNIVKALSSVIADENGFHIFS